MRRRLPSSLPDRVIHLAVAALALLPVALTRFPPLYDYYQWIFQGSVLARLLGWGSTAGDAAVGSYFMLRFVPVPNLGSAVSLALFDAFLDPVNGGRLLIALAVLVYGFGFAYLVRAFQGRPTAAELLGFPWAYGYLMYKGYLASELSMGIAFFAIGKAYGMVVSPDDKPRGKDLTLVAVLGAAAYLFNLFGWLVLALAVVLFSLRLMLRGRRREGVLLTTTLAPTVVMLAWYVASGVGESGFAFYDSWSAKAISMTSALTLYLRTDPFPPPFPLLVVNLLGWSLLLGVVLANLATRESRWVERSAMWLGLALSAIGAALPFYDLGDAARPDERLILPGLLILVAALRFRPLTAGRGLVSAAVVALLLLLHAVEYRRAGASLEQIHATTDRIIAPGTPVYSLVLWESRRRGGCEGDGGGDLSIGAPALKWFDLVRFEKNGGFRANILPTSLVHYRHGHHQTIEHEIRLMSPGDIEDNEKVLSESRRFEVVEIFGCRESRKAAKDLLESAFDLEDEDRWVAILRRRAGEAG